MSPQEGTPRDRFLDAIRVASSDLRSAQSAIQDAQRLNEKYDIDRSANLGRAERDVADAADHLERLSRSWSAGAACFVGTTRILTPTGERPIASLRPGDQVLSWSRCAQGLVRSEVRRARSHGPRCIWVLRGDGAETVETTANHRFLTQRGWTRADHLLAHDRLVGLLDGRPRSIAVQVERSSRVEPVYNLVTAGEHSYVAAGFVVHNYSYLAAPRSAVARAMETLKRRHRPVLSGMPVPRRIARHER
jgi:hypothetical protein